MAHTGIDQEVAPTSNTTLHNNGLGHWVTFFLLLLLFFGNCARVTHNNLGRDLSFSFPQWDTKTMLICYFRRVFRRDFLDMDFLIT